MKFTKKTYMKKYLFVLLATISSVFISSCDNEDEEANYVSDLNGVYSNYSTDEVKNLELSYNEENSVDKEVRLITLDNIYCDITIMNILNTPNVVFKNVKLFKDKNNYSCQMDTLIENKEIHCLANIIPLYNHNNKEEANATMTLKIKETTVE